MVHPAQGKNLLCMPERSFDNKPFKRVYYENTALLIPRKQWIWINLKCGILISLKSLNKLKICRTHLYWNLLIGSVISLWRAQNNLIWAIFGPNSELHHNLYTVINLGPESPISCCLTVMSVLCIGWVLGGWSSFLLCICSHSWWCNAHLCSCCFFWLTWEHTLHSWGLLLGPQMPLDHHIWATRGSL